MEIEIVGINSDMGASREGSSKGVDILVQALNKYNLSKNKIINTLEKNPNDTTHAKHLFEIYDFFSLNLIPELTKVLQNHKIPLIISGDHSSALGSIQAMKKHFNNQNIGIIWIDAHTDIHTPYDSPSGNLHGMPLGGVTNLVTSGKNDLDSNLIKKWQEICQLGGDKNIPPENIIYIGARSYEKSEKEILKKHNVRIFKVNEIRDKFEDSFREIKSLTQKFDKIYLSIDVDVLDKKTFTSTGVLEANGLLIQELEKCLVYLIDMLKQKLGIIEFTEFNPALEYSNPEDNEKIINLINRVIEEYSK